MSGERFLSTEKLERLVADLALAGVRVYAPVEAQGRTEYGLIKDLREAALGGPLPGMSLKSLFCPSSKALACAIVASAAGVVLVLAAVE